MRTLLTLAMLAPLTMAQDYTWREALNAIRHVETGSHKTGLGVVGDNGKALGPYQISVSYTHLTLPTKRIV